MAPDPEQHGITSNGILRKMVEIQPVCRDADGMFPTIFEVLRAQQPSSRIAIFHDWPGFAEPGGKARARRDAARARRRQNRRNRRRATGSRTAPRSCSSTWITSTIPATRMDGPRPRITAPWRMPTATSASFWTCCATNRRSIPLTCWSLPTTAAKATAMARIRSKRFRFPGFSPAPDVLRTTGQRRSTPSIRPRLSRGSSGWTRRGAGLAGPSPAAFRPCAHHCA